MSGTSPGGRSSSNSEGVAPGLSSFATCTASPSCHSPHQTASQSPKCVKSPGLRATIGGSGEIALDALDTDTVHFTIGGSGRVTAAGRADVLEVAVAGSGELSAAKLESRRANIAVQGSAQADVWAKETLNATIAGSGAVNYRGSPQVHRTVVGSGTVRQARETS